MTVPFADLHSIHREVADELDKMWESVIGSSAFIGGPYVETFESEWAEYCEVDHAVGVANGTDALRLTLSALEVGIGDEVIVPTNTFIATAAAVAAVGATPVFVDVDPATLLLTSEHVADAITPRTAAVIPVHLYGQPVDMPALMAVAQRTGIAVVEDAAQAHGARWDGRRVGSFGDAACFSFYPGKNLGALGDGGAVVTSNAKLADRIRQLSNHGRGPDRYLHEVVGSNSRLDGLQAAVLSVKLARLDAGNASRRAAANRYRELLSGLPLEFTQQRPEAESVFHLFVVQAAGRDELVMALESAGISTGLHYPIPCHLQPAFAHLPPAHLPVAEAVALRLLSLPMFPHITDRQIETTTDAIETHLLNQPEASVA
jgi:dTDP-4-amino-4,6-dideoxygalactose transaminase